MTDWNQPGNKNEGGGATYDKLMNRIAKFWAILYSPQLKNIHLPQELNEKTVKNIIQVLFCSFKINAGLPEWAELQLTC